jgi:hypothetical protein
MKRDAYLRAHAFKQVERPPSLWEIDAQDEPFLRVLGEMIAVGLGRGNELSDLVLNVSNVTVEPDAADDRGLAAGDYVAISVQGQGDWEPDERWSAGAPRAKGWIRCIAEAARDAGVRFAYVRSLGETGSLTIFLPRLPPA